MNEDPRYWIVYDPPIPTGHETGQRSAVGMRFGLPFGTDTVGIVDEDSGGIIAYVHETNAQRVVEALMAANGTPVVTTQTAYNDH